MRRRVGLAFLVAAAAACPSSRVRADDAESLRAALEAPPTPRGALPLVELLTSPDPAVRTAAATGLGRLGHAVASVAVPALVDLVAADDAAASAAAEALGRVAGPKDKDEVVPVLRARLAAGHADVALALLRVGVDDGPVLDAVVKAAATGTGDARLAAVKALASRAGSLPAAADALDRLLDDADSVVRAEAANALLYRDGHKQRALERIATAFDDPSPRVRRLALEAVELLGILAKESLPAVVARLSDADADVRAAGAAAIAATGPYAAPHVGALASLSTDPIPRVRLEAVLALVRVGSNSKEVEGALDRFADDGDASIRATVVGWRRARVTDATSVATIAKGLRDPDAVVRAKAAEAARALKPIPDALVSALRDLLHDPDPSVRAEAVKSFGNSPRPEAERLAAITPLLADADAWVRSLACDALVEMPSFDPAPHLASLVQSLDGVEDRTNVARLVARAGPAGVDALLERVRRMAPDEWGRSTLLNALFAAPPSQFERADVRRALVPLWLEYDDSEKGRSEAFGEAMRRDPTSVGEALFAAGDDFEARRAGNFLATAGPQGTRILVEALLQDGTAAPWGAVDGLRDVAAEEVWKAAEPLLRADDARARAAGLRALGVSKGAWPEAAKALVVAALKDDDWRVRRAAATSFGDRPLSTDAVDSLAALVADRFAEVRESARDVLSDHERDARRAVPTLLRLRTSGSPQDRLDLTGLLGWIALPSDATVAAALVEALTDPDERVAAAALGAIDVMQPTDARVIPALAVALGRDKQAAQAAAVLGCYGPDARPALDALERAATSTSKEVRDAAVAALPAVRGDVAAWVALLTARIGRLREIERLAELGSAAAPALPALRKLVAPDNYINPSVRAAATDAIRRIEAASAK